MIIMIIIGRAASTRAPDTSPGRAPPPATAVRNYEINTIIIIIKIIIIIIIIIISVGCAAR